MKKATVKIVGGLGNQMHCYAFGRAIAARNNMKLKLDMESGYWDDPYNREYMLDQFPYLRADHDSIQAETQFKCLLFKCILRIKTAWSRFLPLAWKLVVEEDSPRHYQPEIQRTHYIGNPYFSGYWASYRYYEGAEAEIRQELTPSAPTHPAALEMLARIKSCHSCFIHWRSYNEEKTLSYFDLKQYYQNAVNIIKEKYPDIVFFVFSDDPDCARKIIPLPSAKVVYVDLPASQGNLASLTDFYLMYICDHAIIGHSTFSWWAAWLGECEDKMTIYPHGLSPWGHDWSPPHWLALDLSNIGEDD